MRRGLSQFFARYKELENHKQNNKKIRTKGSVQTIVSAFHISLNGGPGIVSEGAIPLMGVQRSHVFVGVSLVFVFGCYGLAAAESTVTVATYAVDRYEIMRDVLLPQWREKYPDIDIEVQLYPGFFDRMLVVMGTEHAPDIIDTAGTYLFGHVVRGGAVDLSPYIEREPELSPDALGRPLE